MSTFGVIISNRSFFPDHLVLHRPGEAAGRHGDNGDIR